MKSRICTCDGQARDATLLYNTGLNVQRIPGNRGLNQTNCRRPGISSRFQSKIASPIDQNEDKLHTRKMSAANFAAPVRTDNSYQIRRKPEGIPTLSIHAQRFYTTWTTGIDRSLGWHIHCFYNCWTCIKLTRQYVFTIVKREWYPYDSLCSVKTIETPLPQTAAQRTAIH